MSPCHEATSERGRTQTSPNKTTPLVTKSVTKQRTDGNSQYMRGDAVNVSDLVLTRLGRGTVQ